MICGIVAEFLENTLINGIDHFFLTCTLTSLIHRLNEYRLDTFYEFFVAEGLMERCEFNSAVNLSQVVVAIEKKVVILLHNTLDRKIVDYGHCVSHGVVGLTCSRRAVKNNVLGCQMKHSQQICIVFN